MDNLLDNPDFKDQVIQLVEKSFSYPSKFHFEEDFSPLFLKDNLKNLHFLKEEDQVIATALCQERLLSHKNKDFRCLFVGGIAVHPNFRGRALSTQIFNFLESHYKDVLFFILWSDLDEFYQKLGFIQMGTIYEYENHSDSPKENLGFNSNYQGNYQELSESFIIPKRDQPLWKCWDQHQTIKKEDQSLRDKGYDLQDICHEFYPLNQFPHSTAGKIWSPCPLNKAEDTLRYLGLFKIISNKLFVDFISHVTAQTIKIKEMTSKDIIFDFQNQSYELTIQDFLTGLWGPSYIEEWRGLSPSFYIPGFDSI